MRLLVSSPVPTHKSTLSKGFVCGIGFRCGPFWLPWRSLLLPGLLNIRRLDIVHVCVSRLSTPWCKGKYQTCKNSSDRHDDIHKAGAKMKVHDNNVRYHHTRKSQDPSAGCCYVHRQPCITHMHMHKHKPQKNRKNTFNRWGLPLLSFRPVLVCPPEPTWPLSPG